MPLLTLLISSVALQGLAGKRRSVGNRPAPTHRAGQAPGRTSAELRSRPFSAERQLRVQLHTQPQAMTPSVTHISEFCKSILSTQQQLQTRVTAEHLARNLVACISVSRGTVIRVAQGGKRREQSPPGWITGAAASRPPCLPSSGHLLDLEQVEGFVGRCCYLSSLVSIDVNREAIILEAKLLCNLE